MIGGREVLMELPLKRCLLISLCFSVGASAAVFLIALAFFSVHEEAGISSSSALPVAIWAFPVLFLASLLYVTFKNAGERRP